MVDLLERPLTEDVAPEDVAPEEAESGVAELGETTHDEPPEGTVAPSPSRRRRRAKLLLLLALSGLAVLLVAFSGWYLWLRKPISEFPLPGLDMEPMPGYGYSFYGPLRPTGVAVTADGSRVYAVQSAGDTAVLVYDNRGTLLTRMVPPDTGTDHVFVYVAVNPLSGDVYVSDRPIGAIHVYSADGEYRRTFEVPGSLRGWQPLGLAFDSAAHLFVTDAGIGAVHEFDAGGVLLRTIGQVGGFSFPNAAVEDAAGRVYVADSNNGRIVVLDPQGAELSVVGRGPRDGDIGLPRGMAVDDQGRLYVVDTIGHAVKVYRPGDDGALDFLGRFGEPGIGDGGFSFPNAVATDARSRVYVADWSNDRVQVWTY